MKIDGAAVLLTGATGGIGSAAARALAGRGASLVLTGRSEPGLREIAAKTSAHWIAADLTSPPDLDRCAQEARSAFGRIDILINNAGLGWSGRLAAMESDKLETMVALNLLAPMRLTRALLAGMIERRGGHVVNVASIVGYLPVAEEVAYSATKAGIVAFSEALRLELRGTGVGVSVVAPGVVATRFFERRGVAYSRRFPSPMPPERVAQAIVRAIEEDTPEAIVPRWLNIPVRLRGTAPGLYRALAARFG